MDNKDWTIYFPYTSPRKQQEDTINKVLESFKTQMTNLESLMNELKRYDDIENKQIGKVIYE